MGLIKPVSTYLHLCCVHNVLEHLKTKGMLKVIYSNKMTELAGRLARLQLSDPLPPLVAETVIVESNQLARWLSLFLANQHGIASNINFPYSSAFIWQLFNSLLVDVPDKSPFTKDPMTWRLFALLPSCQQQSDFAEINAYLGAYDDALKRYGLARRIANNFDQYLLYRPDWIKAWEQGESPHWQARLWQQLVADKLKPMHRANLLFQLCDYLAGVDERPACLPPRMAIFGLSSLPPVYLQLFKLLARFCDVYTFFLSPSKEYWGDLITPKKRSKQLIADPEEAAYLTTGHPLLASLGKQGQTFFAQLTECELQEETIFIPPDQGQLLNYLQYDIFSLREPNTSAKRQIKSEDDSIRIHVCHSPMREVEVLHDQLLALFERYPALSPTDIIVMIPYIERYTSAINAVFGCAPTDHHIPYSIADGRAVQQGPVMTAFNALLSLPQSRLEVDSVVALLACVIIQKRFLLDEDQFELIKRWLQKTQIKWGLSAEDKIDLGLPATATNTWRAGLDRLLLGYAMPFADNLDKQQLFAGKLAFAGISGEQAETMARLCAFIDRLDEYRQRLNADLTVGDWQNLLYQLLDDFFIISADNRQHQSELLCIRKAISYLVETLALADFKQTIGIDVVKAWLNDQIDTNQAQADTGFMGHGVTFCRMVPMRSIPAEVICLIGMNYDNYPRQQFLPSFDLLKNDVRQGDRSVRDDDRYLFLESLLSAQSHLYISYVGASIQDNMKIPPSVLVSDLCDVLRQSFETVTGGDIWQACLTEHPLQGFSRRYFSGASASLFSYADERCPPISTKDAVTPWFDGDLPEADASWRQVSLHQLSKFFHHPASYLCKQRLGLCLKTDDIQLDSREPFVLDNLQGWQLRQQLVHRLLQAKTVSNILPMVRAQGILPQGNLGDYVLNEQIDKVKDFADGWLADYPDKWLAPLSFELSINGFTLYGDLERLSDQGLFTWSMSKAKGGRLLEAWLSHLVLSCLKPENINVVSRWIAQDADYSWEYVDNAKSILADLLALYWQGLHQPLPLFAKTSFAYAKARPEKRDNSALRAWNGSPNIPGEKQDDYYQHIYTTSPLDEQFKELALAVYEPVKEYLPKGKL